MMIFKIHESLMIILYRNPLSGLNIIMREVKCSRYVHFPEWVSTGHSVMFLTEKGGIRSSPERLIGFHVVG